MSEDELYSVLVRVGFFEELGYGRFSVDVKPQYVVPGERKKADYVCRDEYQNVIFVLEAKKPREERLEDALGQLWERYVLPLKAFYGVLTNGKRFIVYKRVGVSSEPLLDFDLKSASEADCNQLHRILKKPEYDLTLHSKVQEYFEKVEKLSLKTELAKENFFETFKLNPDSIFGKLVADLMRLFDWVYPRSKFLKGAYGFWRRSFARQPERIPDSWEPFLMGDGNVFKFMFCLESAHALLARLILAKACEDLKFPGIGISNFVVQKIHQFRGQIPLVGYPIVLLKLLKEMKDQLVYSIFEEDIFGWWSDAFASLSERSSGELLQEKVDKVLEDFSETIARLLFILYKYDFSEVAGDPLGDLYQQYFDKETRKALGEFYTPVEVVNYILDAVEYKYVRHKRLLDPACGSGTFLVEALKRYLKEMEPVAKDNGWAFVLKELCNSPRIVGFDIHPFACLIAQVRFMLELIPFYKKAIEEEKLVVYESLQRLPIFRTDSLSIEMETQELLRGPKMLVSDEDVRFTISLPMRANDEKTVTVKVMIPSWKKTSVGTNYNLFNLDEYFCVTQAIFDAVKAMIKIEAEEIPTKGLEAHIKKYLTNKDFHMIAEFFKPYADRILSEIRRLHKEFEDGRLIKSIEDAILAAILKNYLQYDVVVGNPPYVRVQRLTKEMKDVYRNLYDSASGKFDIYVFFIERGIKWLATHGKLGYICSNQFLIREYGRELRKLILKSCSVREIIDFGDSGVFQDVANYPCIFIIEKGRKNGYEFIYVRVADKITDEKGEDISLYHIRKNIKNFKYSDDKIDIFNVKQDMLNEAFWELMPEEERKTFLKIQKNSTCPLRNLIERIYEGLITGANDVYFVDENVLEKYGFEIELLKPIPKGKDVRKWQIIWDRRYVIYPHEKKDFNVVPMDLSNYPKIENYLLNNKKKLEARHYVIEAGKRWYEIWNPRDPEWFDRPKIVTPNLSRHNNFAYDDGIMLHGIRYYYYLDHDCYGIILSSNNKADHLYLLGLLNSKILEFYIKHISPYCAGKYFRYMTGYLEELPIKLPMTVKEHEIAEKIIKKVEDILSHYNIKQLTETFPESYLNEYKSAVVELDEVSYTFHNDHSGLQPILTGLPEKGYAVYPHENEDPILVESREKAQYLLLTLQGKSARRNETMKILIPRDNFLVSQILSNFETKLKSLQKVSVEKLEAEVNGLVYCLYDLDEQDKAVIESFLQKF
jgi:type I restriction-modification system DNA methylase subunit